MAKWSYCLETTSAVTIYIIYRIVDFILSIILTQSGIYSNWSGLDIYGNGHCAEKCILGKL